MADWDNELGDIHLCSFSDIVLGQSSCYDTELQEYAQTLMQNKSGVIIVTAPLVDSVLACVAAPNSSMLETIRPLINVCEMYARRECLEEDVEQLWKNVNGAPGTGAKAWIAHVDGLDICGEARNPEYSDGSYHSAFWGFAPKDNPQIAVVVFIENGRYGNSYAAPIGSLVIEKYLTGDVSRKHLEMRMETANLIERGRNKLQ